MLWDTTRLDPMDKARLAAGVLWKKWQDGLAVYVASTCETHVLSSDLLPIFMGDLATNDQFCQAGQQDSASLETDNLISREILNLLVSLKIIDLVD